jgi:16S rRNA (cytosine1402-N4)-methyltransferase
MAEMKQEITSPHTSVLLKESLEGMNINPDGVYMDGTFGRGGHSRGLLAQLSSRATLVGVDRDPSAIEYGKEHFHDEQRLHLMHTDFANIRKEVAHQGLPEKYDGILFDLGVSSPQLDEAERGFSFMRDGPLDMRMDTSRGQTAAEWLAYAEEKDIANVIFHLGDEKYSRRIAREIVERRIEEPFTQTAQLVDLLEEVITRKEKHKHPATRTFLALRMYINDELGQVETMLPEAVKMLNPGGRIVIISFHSREDRIVKQYFREISRGPKLPRRLPVQGNYQAPLKLIGKAYKPSKAEIQQNPRSRSAVLRIAERTEVAYD